MTSGNSTPGSPFGLAREVEQLLKLPGSLCKQRGICCRVATFKGSLDHQAIKALAAEQNQEGQMARDFLSIFLPYPDQDSVQALAPEFVEKVRNRALEKGQDPDATTFYHCRYVQADGRCGVHEDRPEGCRSYPNPLPNTIFHPGCGYEQQARANMNRIGEILDTLGTSFDEVMGA